MTVVRERHAFEGQTLAVISSIRRRGVLLLLVSLPDGSRSLIPAKWTSWEEGHIGSCPPDDDGTAMHRLGRLGDLLQLRKVIDALSGRHDILGVRERSDKLVRELVLDHPAPFVPLVMKKRGKEIEHEAKTVLLAGRRTSITQPEPRHRAQRIGTSGLTAAAPAAQSLSIAASTSSPTKARARYQ